MANKQHTLQSEQALPRGLINQQTGGACQAMPAHIRQRYEDIAQDSRYQHFVRIPPRIVRCLDYFGMKFSRTIVRERLLAYYLFIGVVDETLDFGNLNIGKSVLEHFERPFSCVDEQAAASTVELVTEVLKRHITDENRCLISVRLAELYREVVGEQAATSIKTYIEHRKTIGSRTAELSYILIQDLLSGDVGGLCRLMKQAGRVGCLVDSVIDLNMDWRLGLLRFRPSARDRITLTAGALREGVRTLLQYPSLAAVFLAALVDNSMDPLRMTRAASVLINAETKDEVAGVI